MRKDPSRLGCKVFSATKAHERSQLGERVTEWIAEHPDCTVVDHIVNQSSDSAFHCLSITIFFKER
jgi:hypothetical protein